MINLAIISDIRLYREGLGKILNEIEGINVVGVIEGYKEIFTISEIVQLDVVLLDIRMRDSMAMAASVTSEYSSVKIIVTAVPDNDNNYLQCIESGITGYLLNDSTIDELIDAVKTVDKGSMYCPCAITQYILRDVKNKRDEKKINEDKSGYSKSFNLLTQRELQIVNLLTEGMSNKAIAKNLTIELSTVKNHVHNILVKMGVESRTQVACMLQETVFIQRNRSIDLDPQLDLS